MHDPKANGEEFDDLSTPSINNSENSKANIRKRPADSLSIPITKQERAFLAQGTREGVIKFYKSRLSRGDSYAQTALGVVENNTKMGHAANAQLLLAALTGETPIPKGGPDKFLLNVSLGLANAHAQTVTNDFDRKQGVPGLLNKGQIQGYHERYFESIGLSKDTFGGTTFGWNNDPIFDWCKGGCDAK